MELINRAILYHPKYASKWSGADVLMPLFVHQKRSSFVSTDGCFAKLCTFAAVF